MKCLAVALFLVCLPQADLQIQKRELQKQGNHYSVRVEYPEISNAQIFNSAVSEAVTSLTQNFLKEGRPDPDDVGTRSYLQGGYKSEVLKNGVVSVLLDYDEYTSGAAHPWGVMATINYDSKACRVLKLSDLFRPNTNYVARISQLAITSLEQNEYAQHTAIEQGAGPTENNFRYFTLTESAIVFHFPMYQVAPGAAGEQTVKVPFSQLSSVFRNPESR